MTEVNGARRASQADLLTSCAAGLETAIVGIISLVLPDDALDSEMVDIKEEILGKAHRLRQLAVLLVKG